MCEFLTRFGCTATNYERFAKCSQCPYSCGDYIYFPEKIEIAKIFTPKFNPTW